MIDPYLLTAISVGGAIVTGLLAHRAWRWRAEALALATEARVTYDHAADLYVEATHAYREATEAAVAARSANRQAFQTMAALAEEGSSYHRGTRH